MSIGMDQSVYSECSTYCEEAFRVTFLWVREGQGIVLVE